MVHRVVEVDLQGGVTNAELPGDYASWAHRAVTGIRLPPLVPGAKVSFRPNLSCPKCRPRRCPHLQCEGSFYLGRTVRRWKAIVRRRHGPGHVVGHVVVCGAAMRVEVLRCARPRCHRRVEQMTWSMRIRFLTAGQLAVPPRCDFLGGAPDDGGDQTGATRTRSPVDDCFAGGIDRAECRTRDGQ